MAKTSVRTVPLVIINLMMVKRNATPVLRVIMKRTPANPNVPPVDKGGTRRQIHPHKSATNHVQPVLLGSFSHKVVRQFA